jgi:C-terminal processing protease CtpA/Prc
MAWLAPQSVAGFKPQDSAWSTPAASAQPEQEAFTAELVDRVLAALQDHIARRVYVHGVDFGEWPNHVARYGNAIDNAQTPGQLAAALNEAMQRFGISHAAVIPPSGARELARSGGGGIGIGAALRPASGGGLRVLNVPDASAAKGLLWPGDVILSVDGVSVKDESGLEGEVDSVAVLRVRRVRGGATEEVRVPRMKQPTAEVPVGFELMEDDAALIRIDSFGDSYNREDLERRFAEIKDRRFLVLDLRGNSGGRVDHFLHLLSFFFEPGTVVGLPVGSEDAAKFVVETGLPPSNAFLVAAWMEEGYTIALDQQARFEGQVAVLIDGGSASASECSASALRELRRSPLVGSRSSGALLVSRFLPLPGGFAMQAPVMDYITVRGFRPEGVGLAPDIAVRSRDRQEAVRVALERLRAAPGLGAPARLP